MIALIGCTDGQIQYYHAPHNLNRGSHLILSLKERNCNGQSSLSNMKKELSSITIHYDAEYPDLLII